MSDASALELRPHSFSYRHRPTQRSIRRTFDIVLASMSLPIVIPILTVACAAIALEDGPPFFFRQRRVGRFERTFTIFKLRTMRKDLCGDEVKPASGRDPRITRVGAILRKLSVDEVPQLFNVLRGDMTLVGPRPEMPFVVQRYERWQHLRHLVTPGLTCLWQTTCRSTVPLHHPEATALDLTYIRTQNFALDVRLLGSTVASVLGTKGAF
ncbi:MAG: hypothetical protein NVS4B5_04840 [Vulcanimicrobiaceae bacterium]